MSILNEYYAKFLAILPLPALAFKSYLGYGQKQICIKPYSKVRRFMPVHHHSYPVSSSFEPDVVCSVSVMPFPLKYVLFACLSSGWTTTTDRLLGPKMRDSIKCLFQGHSDALSHWVEPRFRNLSITSSTLYQLSHAAATSILLCNVVFYNSRTVLWH